MAVNGQRALADLCTADRAEEIFYKAIQGRTGNLLQQHVVSLA